MSLNSATIAAGIAALSISGVHIYDIDDTPVSFNVNNLPALFPMPNGWKKGGNSEPSEGPATFGSPTARMWVFNRTYSYVYLHTPVGSGRNARNYNKELSDKDDAIVTALTAIDIAGVDLKSVNISAYGTIDDELNGGKFYGFILTLVFRERVNP